MYFTVAISLTVPQYHKFIIFSKKSNCCMLTFDHIIQLNQAIKKLQITNAKFIVELHNLILSLFNSNNHTFRS